LRQKQRTKCAVAVIYSMQGACIIGEYP